MRPERAPSLVRPAAAVTAAMLAAVGFLCLGLAGVGAQQPPTFRSGVEVVLIDVTVVDRSGQPVGDLRPGDFTVIVDGKVRSVASAQFLKYETRTTTVREKSAVAAPAVRVGSTAAAQRPHRHRRRQHEPGDGLRPGRPPAGSSTSSRRRTGSRS